MAERTRPRDSERQDDAGSRLRWSGCGRRRSAAAVRQAGTDREHVGPVHLTHLGSKGHQKCVAKTLGGPGVPSMILVPNTNWTFLWRQSLGAAWSATPRYSGSVTNSLAASVP